MDFDLTREQEAFRASVRTWVESHVPKPVARRLEAAEFEFPHELWDEMATAGFHGIGIPEEYGGEGGDVVVQAILARELARTMGGLAWMWGIPSFCAKSVLAFGSDELRAATLPALVRGDARMAISVTEPAGGTDLLGQMRTTGVRVDGGWRVTGQKTWSSGAMSATHLLLLARTELDADRPARAVTAFLVPNPSVGLDIRPIPKLGMRAFASCEVFLDGVFVPDRLIVGDPGMGWYQMLATLNNERILVAATCTGILEGVLEDAIANMNERAAFGRTIGEFQVLQHYVADMSMWLRQAELLTYHAAWRQQRGDDCAVEANMAKVVASEYATQAADLGIQILGGMGYSAETDMQRAWRDARLYRIGPVTNEMARNLIAESYGLPRSF